MGELIRTEKGYLLWSGEKIAELQATADKYKGRWERVEELNRLLVEQSDRRLELLKEIYETDGVGLTSYILVKIEEELGDDYFNRHTT